MLFCKRLPQPNTNAKTLINNKSNLYTIFGMLGFTIDSINLFVSWEYLSDFDFKNFEKFVNAKMTRRGKYKGWYEGGYRNFRIRYNSNYGIYVMGSISNYYRGYAFLLQHKDLRLAIDKLGNELGLYLHSARLYRVDLALNILTDKPISHYNRRLFTDLPRFKRLEQDDGVRFQTLKIAFAIYNKLQELFDKREIEISENILRLELRLLKGISEELMIKEMKIQDLYSLLAFRLLVGKFQEYYNKIKKRTVLVGLDEIETITPTIISNYLKRNSVENTFGGEDEAYRFVEQLSIQGKFKNANDKSRCRKVITDFSQNKAISKLHPLIEEINRKVDEECSKIMKNEN